jgi:outer membrane protein
MTRRLTLAVFALLIPVLAQAQLKIGYINPQEVIAQMPEAQAAQATLQTFIQEKQQSIAEKQRAYQAALQDYQSRAEVLSEQQNTSEQQKLMGLQTELQELDSSICSQVQEKQASLFQPIMNKINDAIVTVSEEQELDFVFNSGTNSGDSIILHVDKTKEDELNITSEVLAKVTQ